MNQPFISIIVPCYNQAQYLDECLQSVFNQTYQNWECIIVNDGSPDNTEEHAKKWTEKDSRFKYLFKENGGLSSARNAGIEIANGEWILPLDSDDKIGSQYLELGSQQFDKGYTVIYCEAEFFGVSEGKWNLPDFDIKEFAIQNLIFCTAFYKKSEWKKVNGYDENLKNAYEDWEFWISLLKSDFKVYRINEICFYYRIKINSMTTDFHKEKVKKKATLNYIYKKHIDFFLEYLPIIQEVILENKNLIISNVNLLTKINSKRYRMINKILSLFSI